MNVNAKNLYNFRLFNEVVLPMNKFKKNLIISIQYLSYKYSVLCFLRADVPVQNNSNVHKTIPSSPPQYTLPHVKAIKLPELPGIPPAQHLHTT